MYRSLILLYLSLQLSATLQANGKTSYLDYYDLINAAEEAYVVNNDTGTCFRCYDKAFNLVTRPFIKDYYIAAEIACYTGSNERMLQYLDACFARGLPLNCLHAAPVFGPLLANAEMLAVINKSYTAISFTSIDSALRDSTYQRYYTEQALKKNIQNKTAFQAAEKDNTEYFGQLLSKGVFPSEQLIGLFTGDGIAAYISSHHLQPLHSGPPPVGVSGDVKITGAIPYEYALWNGAAYYSFIHYPCGFTRYKQDFWKAVELGYVHPKDYCMLEEWAAIGSNNAAYLQDCNEPVARVYYNITPKLTVTSTDDILRVEENRAARHLQRYSTDLRKTALQHQTGILFFFGFFDWR